jgi:hydroxypyruvate isomerase
MAPVAKRLGLKAIDLLTPKEWGPLKEHGLICSMTSGVHGGIETGLNRVENHEPILKTLRELIDASAEAGYPNVICFSGNRHLKRKGKGAPLEGKISDEEGIRNCAAGLKQIMAHAEQKKVTVCMELLNSKVNHPDYMCDTSTWGVELCKAVGSERFKLLYDIYHMQIMEGDIIATIRDRHPYFGHYHTGGVPGRHEIDETQELNWPAIMKAIVDTGFKGYVAQEFIPAKPDKVASLAAAVQVCDV